MSIHTEMANLLDRVARQGISAGDKLEVSVPVDAGGHLECSLLEVDSIGCSFEQLLLTTPRLANASPQSLTATGDKLANRLNYLAEPIRTIELDEEALELQQRSVPPQIVNGERNYYELTVQAGGSIALKRYRKAAGEPRQPTPCLVTRETLLRLCDDLCGCWV